MITRRSVLSLCAATPVALAAWAARATEPPVFASGGVAINGTDPVAYFTEGAPVAGTAAFAVDWMGARWLFASDETQAAFAEQPDRYAPRFGGYCAWAVSRGYIAETVPEAWTIHEGRLYLNASLRIRRRWERDIPGNIARGEANWPAVLG